MESVIGFAKNASPIVLSLAATLGLIHVVILLLEGRGIIKKGVQKTEVNTSMNIAELQHLDRIEKLLIKVSTNHLHGLPDMESAINRIETKVDKLADDLVNVRERVARLE